MTKKAVFLITIDDVRSDHTSMEGWKRDTTPFLEKFSEEGEYLENHYSVGPSSPTSFRSMLSSTTPISFLDYDQLSSERPYLPEKLSENGVYTVGLTTNPYVSSYFGFDRGFDDFLDYSKPEAHLNFGEELGALDKIKKILAESKTISSIYNELRKLKKYRYPYLTAEKVVERFQNFIESGSHAEEENVFFWIHFMDAHEPFVPPKETIGTWSDYDNPWKLRGEFEDLHQDQEWGQISKLYDECISYLDSNLEKLTRFIESEFSNTDTTIIIASDHGELIGEKDMLGHYEILEKELYSVPAVIKTDNDLNLEGTTTHLDLPTTILDLFDISSSGMKGVPLTSENPPDERFVEACEDGEERWRKDPEGYSAGVVNQEGFVSKFEIGTDSFEEAHEVIKENIPSVAKLWLK